MFQFRIHLQVPPFRHPNAMPGNLPDLTTLIYIVFLNLMSLSSFHESLYNSMRTIMCSWWKIFAARFLTLRVHICVQVSLYKKPYRPSYQYARVFWPLNQECVWNILFWTRPFVNKLNYIYGSGLVYHCRNLYYLSLCIYEFYFGIITHTIMRVSICTRGIQLYGNSFSW